MQAPHIEQGTDDDNTKRTQTLAMICEQYPQEAWTRVYTHGSATNVFQNGGAGIDIYFPNGSKKTASAATRRHYSNCKTASEALIIAISIAVDSKLEEHYNCISHIYALSSTSPDQQQIYISSKSSVTTQQQYYSVALQ